MKNLLLITLMFCACFSFAQKKKPIPTTGTKKTNTAAVAVALPPLAGKYSGKQANGIVDSLIIKSDSTYRFASYQPGMSTPESFTGKYKVKKNDIFLLVGTDPEPYGQVKAILAKDGSLEKFKIVRYFGNLQKMADQPELKK